MIALDRTWLGAARAGPGAAQVLLQLGVHQGLLQLPEDGLGLIQGKADVLDLVAGTVDGVDWHGDGV